VIKESVVTVSVGQLVTDYLDDCRARGLSQATLRAYAWSLETLLKPWCQEEGIETLEQLDQRQLNRLSNHLLSRPGRRPGSTLARQTVVDYLKPIRVWMGWCEAELGMASGGKPKLPRLNRHLIRPLNREEIQAMEDAAASERDKLIIRLLGDVGLRVGELCGLRIQDLVLHDRQWYLQIRGKGGNERRVGVPYLGPRLKRYLRYRPDGSDHLFLTLRANSEGWRDGIHREGVERMIRFVAKAAGIQRRIYPHLLRHSAITNLHGKGMNSFQLGTVVGNHSHLATYTHLEAEDTYNVLRDLLAED
jgi:integrase/recombinase XerD